MVDHYPLCQSTWGPEEHEAIARVIDSGQFTMGERVAHFERDFAAYFGARHAVMVNSGSSANLLAIAALFYKRSAPLQPGDEVIVPAVSWSTTYSPLQQYGLHIKFVDIDPQTMNLDLELVRRATGPRTRLVFAVNLLGNPVQLDQLRSLCDAQDIILVEDNCESMGARVDNRFAGTFGLSGTFSTFFSHHIATMEGGMIVTDDEEMHQLLVSLRSHGWTRSLPEKNFVTSNMGQSQFERAFRFVLPGYNLRPTELSAAIGVEQLKKLPGFVAQRRQNAELFRDLFADHPQLRIQRETGQSSWFGFALVLRTAYSAERNALVEHLQSAGIECRPVVAGNFARQEMVKYFDYEIVGTLDNADELDRSGFYVGNHHIPLEGELNHLRERIDQYFAQR